MAVGFLWRLRNGRLVGRLGGSHRLLIEIAGLAAPIPNPSSNPTWIMRPRVL